MRSVKQLIQDLNTKESQRVFDALKTTDDNVIELLNRVSALERRNMKYHCRLSRSSNLVILNVTLTVPAWDITFYPQFGNLHDNVSNSGAVEIRRSGVYRFSSDAAWNIAGAAPGAIIHYIQLLRNAGAAVYNVCHQRYYVSDAGSVWSTNVSGEFYCYEGDMVYVVFYHSLGAGATVTIVASPPYSPFFAVTERMEDLDPSQYGLLNPEANTR